MPAPRRHPPGLRVITLLAVLLLGGCADAPLLRASSDPVANFADYRSYGWYAEPDAARAGQASIVSSTLNRLVAREMEQRGYLPSPTPDLWINCHARRSEARQIAPVPGAAAPLDCPYRSGRYHAWSGYDEESAVRDCAEGTLNIDLIDTAHRQLVWEGVAIGALTERSLRDPGTALPAVVKRIFSLYPYHAGRSVAYVP